MKTFSKITLAAAALALLGIAASSPRGDEGRHSDARWKTIVIDVAEDARTASLNSASATDTEPKRGATAIINGKIYPGGTIAAGNGLDIDTLTGSIGTWLTRHTFNVDLSQILAGAHPALSSTSRRQQHWLRQQAFHVYDSESGLSGRKTRLTTPCNGITRGPGSKRRTCEFNAAVLSQHLAALGREPLRVHRCTRAPPPFISFSTSSFDAIEVSPGVVIASAPCAAPYSTAFCGSPVVIRP